MRSDFRSLPYEPIDLPTKSELDANMPKNDRNLYYSLFNVYKLGIERINDRLRFESRAKLEAVDNMVNLVRPQLEELMGGLARVLMDAEMDVGKSKEVHADELETPREQLQDKCKRMTAALRALIE
jgi:hypothetical protein